MVTYTDKLGFQETVSAAIDDMLANGFDSIERVNQWMQRIRMAAQRSMVSESKLTEGLKRTFKAIYTKQIDGGALLRHHPGVDQFTVQRVTPRLRAELDRRIMASAQLIKLNRDEAVERTLRRFSGWATSIPDGGTDATGRRAAKLSVKKSLSGMSFIERRVAIDQGHKFTAALSEIIADDQGAIAGIWHSHWKQVNYNFRRDHKERDGVVFAVRDNWAMQRRLMKLDGHEYTDDITRPGEEVNCRCYYQWLYSLRKLPDGMVTALGKSELERVRAQLRAA